MNDKRPNPHESLALITEMISSTRQHVTQQAHIPFLIWGYTTIVVTLAVWYGYKTTSQEAWFWLWYAIPVVGWLGMFTTRNKRHADGYVRTPIDRAISHIWVVLAVVALVVTIASFIRPLPILMMIIMFMGSGAAISGLIIRMHLFTIAGFVGILLSLLFLFVQGIDQCLIFAAIFLVMMVIPGHIIQYQQSKVSCNV